MAKRNKNGYPESRKVCYCINLKKYRWCKRNHCIANFPELIKYGSQCAQYVCMRLIQTLLYQQRVIQLKSKLPFRNDNMSVLKVLSISFNFKELLL